MKKTRKKIPLTIQSAVRKRCGFGCVVCGMPVLVEIDHIEEFSKEKKHEESNLTLLCANHHSEKTKGLLTKEEIIDANKNPYAIQQKTSSPYQIRLNQQVIKVKFGSCNTKVSLQRGKSDLILLDRTPIISIEYKNGRPILTMKLYGEQNNLLVAIINNEMTFLNHAYDINNQGRSIFVREKKGEILLELELSDSINIKKGKIKYNNRTINITPKEIEFEGTKISAAYFEGPFGLACGKKT